MGRGSGTKATSPLVREVAPSWLGGSRVLKHRLLNANSPSPQPSPRRGEGELFLPRAQRGQRPLPGEPVGEAARLVVAGGAVAQHLTGRLKAELGDHPRRS